MALAIVAKSHVHDPAIDAAVGAMIECLDESVKPLDARARFEAMQRLHSHLAERMHSMTISGLPPVA